VKLKIDENLPVEAAEIFNKAGFTADTVHNENLTGAADSRIYLECLKEHRALVTLDLDFSDIRRYIPSKSFGIIILRLLKQDKISVLQIIKQIIPRLKIEILEGKLWIVEKDRIRIRE
jgi:predicted nuclease of predicted toxin-antitoxin system